MLEEARGLLDRGDVARAKEVYLELLLRDRHSPRWDAGARRGLHRR